MTTNLKQNYNLPNEVLFCKSCVISNQRPRITFNENGICSACEFSNYKHNLIDWQAREQKLQELCNTHRKSNGIYDVIVPCSGGKDSSYVAHKLKSQYGMNPLTVTWSPHLYTDIGRSNLTSFIDSGFDNILITPRGDIHRKLTKAAFLLMGDPFQPFIFGQYSVPFRAALHYDVSLVFYGEDGEVEYGGSMKHANRASLSYEDFVRNRFSNIYPQAFAQFGISETDLEPYKLSENELIGIREKNIEQHFFSYYQKWVPQENFYYAAEHCNFRPNPSRNEGTYSKYASLDDKLDGFHYYLGFIKFGIGRCTSDAAHEIRDGHISREEAVSLVRKYDGEFPSKHFDDFLEYCVITEDEFYSTVDSWRSDRIWTKANGEWKLKYMVE